MAYVSSIVHLLEKCGKRTFSSFSQGGKVVLSPNRIALSLQKGFDELGSHRLIGRIKVGKSCWKCFFSVNNFLIDISSTNTSDVDSSSAILSLNILNHVETYVLLLYVSQEQ